MDIVLKSVSKSFNKVDVLKNINLEFKSGNIYGLYGRNGAGKSVLLKLISGYYVPTNGEILYNSINLNLEKKFPTNLRALIDKPSFYPDLNGFDNLMMLARLNNKIGENEVLDSLDIVNLIAEKDKKFGDYSLGMKQKLGFAQVIMDNPDIYIFDEPFNGIENKTVDKLIDYLLKIKDNKIIIVSTHVKEDLIKLSDYIISMDNGQVTEIKKNER